MAALNAKIKGIKADTGGSAATGGDGAVASAPTAIVTIVDDKSGAEYEFEQPNYKGLLLNVGDAVKYETIDIPGAKPVVVYARRIQSGFLASLDLGNIGTITEKRSKKMISFFQVNQKELGFVVGEKVRYDLISDLNGGELAVNVRLADDEE